jgi:hypothetical protein
LTEEEMDEMMKDDFRDDSGGDGSVDREEFRFAVFQLADQWTSTTEVEEYVEFLKRGYSIVFSDLLEADKLQWPMTWASELRKVKNVNRMPLLRCVDVMTGVLRAKFRADLNAREKNKELQTLQSFVVDYFKVLNK